MQFVLFYHSLVSDWNHGNAHFLRGVARELLVRGHEVVVYEPRDGWSLQNLCAERGRAPIDQFRQVYPQLQSRFYEAATIDLDRALDAADVVIVHEWNDPQLVQQLGEQRRRRRSFRLLFHDTHHRSVTQPAEIRRYDLSDYDGVLAFGEVIRDLYLEQGWAQEAWTWHEAADVQVFHPLPHASRRHDLVWIGNWGDDERTEELLEFLLEPVARLRLKAVAHGVRYPEQGQHALAAAGIGYRGWLPNFLAPQLFAAARSTVHIPRRPYREQLPGIPTIRVFEALACGIPLVSAPWEDIEHLFRPGEDYLVARDGTEMREHLRAVLHDRGLRRQLADNGRRRILAQHTCGHRVDQLLEICAQLRAPGSNGSRVLLPRTPLVQRVE